MASEAQIRANRLNALKSTGPRTLRGKAMASQNAIKHGMTAVRVVLFDEVRADFEKFHAGLVFDFQPQGTAEVAPVERIAMLAWRLRRASRAEAALANGEAKSRRERLALAGPHPLHRIDASIMFDRFVHNMTTLTRYEPSIEHQLNRAIIILERLQVQRSRREERDEAEREIPVPESAGRVLQELAKQSQFAEGNQRAPAAGSQFKVSLKAKIEWLRHFRLRDFPFRLPRRRRARQEDAVPSSSKSEARAEGPSTPG